VIARLAVLGVVLGALWVVLSLDGDAGPPPPPLSPSAPPATPEPEQPSIAARVTPVRNLFEFGAAPAPRAPLGFGFDERVSDESAVPLQAPPPRVLLVGLVRRGTAWMAALSIAGEVLVLAPGETAEGYTLLAVDEETGVRLGSPEGELALPRPD